MPNLTQGQGSGSHAVYEDNILTTTGSVLVEFTEASAIDIRNNVAVWGVISSPERFKKRGHVRITALADASYTINNNPSKADIDAFNLPGSDNYNSIPQTFSTRTLSNGDNGKTLIPSDASQTATVPLGLVQGFGCAFNNNVTVSGFSGAAGTVTVIDKRTTGATNPTCAIINTGTNTYELWGSKT